MRQLPIKSVTFLIWLPPLGVFIVLCVLNLLWFYAFEHRRSLRWEIVSTVDDSISLLESSSSRIELQLQGEQVDLPISVDVTTVSGSAKADKHFRDLKREIRFTPGVTSAFLDLHGIDNDVVEIQPRSFQILLKNPKGASLRHDNIEVWLQDDDEIEFISQLSPLNVMSPLEIFVPVETTKICDQPIRIAFSSRNGTAAEGRDFQAISGSTELRPGQRGFLIPVSIIKTPSVKTEKDFWLDIRASSLDGKLLRQQSLLVTLRFAGSGSMIAIETSDVMLSPQGTAAAVVRFKLSKPSLQTVIFKAETVDETAVGGRHYESAQKTLEFLSGQTELQWPIRLLPAGESDFDKKLSFKVRITEIDGILQDGVESRITLHYPPPPPQLIIAPISVCPPALEKEEVTLPVRLDKPYSWPVSVSYQTEDGTAIAGRDYLGPISGRLLFDGKTEAEIKIHVYGLPFTERQDRSFKVKFFDPSNLRLSSSSPLGNPLKDGVITIQRQPALPGDILAILPVTESLENSTLAEKLLESLRNDVSLLGGTLWLVGRNQQPIPLGKGLLEGLIPFSDSAFEDAFQSSLQVAAILSARAQNKPQAIFIAWFSDSNPDYDAPSAMIQIPDDLPIRCIWIREPLPSNPQRASVKLRSWFKQGVFFVPPEPVGAIADIIANRIQPQNETQVPFHDP